MHLPRVVDLGRAKAMSLPLLVYMHGTGCVSFLKSSKKAMQTPGMVFAASQFIICSPKCEWTWKQTPSPWVEELVHELRRASWVDASRVYLSGNSMGGMGTWEIASRMPDVFAAIAAVSAHHRHERTQQLAEKLRNVPIFAVHSADDSTCPVSEQLALWTELRALRNRFVRVDIATGLDHGTVFDRAYCDDIVVYEWLLTHRKPAVRDTNL